MADDTDQGQMVPLNKLMPKLVEMIAKMHGGQQQGGQMPMPGMTGGQQQSNIQPGGGFQSPANAISGPAQAGGLAPTPFQSQPQGGMPAGGQGSAPPQGPGGQLPNYVNAGPPQGPAPQGQPQQGEGGSMAALSHAPQQGAGQTMGAPQLPQGGGATPQGGGDLPQAPFSGGHPAAAMPAQNYGDFVKAAPLPKPPSWDDAVGVAEQMRQGAVGGSMQPGAGGGIGTSPQLVQNVMGMMNEQYGKQLEAHTGLWQGQLAAAHMHNQDLSTQERMQHDRAQEAYQNRALQQRGDQFGQKQQLAENKFTNLQDHQSGMMQIAKDKVNQAQQALAAAVDDRAKKAAYKALEDAKRDQRAVEGLKLTAAQNPNADPKAAKKITDEAMSMDAGGGAAPDASQKPQAPPEAIAYLKAHPETKSHFEEKYAPVQ